MQPVSRIILSAALLAPALQADVSRTLARPRTTLSATVSGVAPAHFGAHLANLGDSGFGAGMWIPPTDLPGFASAQLFDGMGHLRYTMRASLLAAQAGPPTMDQQGGFLGLLFSVDASGQKSPAAQISGKWIRHPNGWGEFDVEVLVESGDRNQPLVSIGQIQGSLLPVGIIPGPGIEPIDGGEVDPSAPGELVLMWSIPEES
jgi:hypothetical protein